MSYLPLARKYRPGKFKDLVGQEAVSLALSNGIRIGREPAAVMFSGIRGIGKTTTARIYAKALNCSQPVDTEPCDECDSCLSINRGSHEDVIEVDGASHNGVDEVRSLKETVQYLPQRSRYKVYIIDEVHMLSVNAFNALLKTLEEPPPQVIFIFATTELQKVPQTITGRCQTFYLKKMTRAHTEKRLRDILESEGISCDDQSLSLIAKQGHGSMRDALTFLDQAIALGSGTLNHENLSPLVTGLSGSIPTELLSALIKRDAAACSVLTEKMDECGQDYTDAVEDLARMARCGFLLQGLGEDKSSHLLSDLSDQEKTELAEIVKEAAPFDLNRIFRFCVRCRQDLDGGDLDRYIFENYCLEWCLDPGIPDISELLRGGSVNKPARSAAPAQSSPAPAKEGSKAGGSQTLSRPSLVARFKEGLKSNIPAEPSTPVTRITEAEKKKPAPLKPASPSPLPEDWAGFVASWVDSSPFGGRILEEVAPESYSPELISVRAGNKSMAAAEFAKPETLRKVQEYLRQQFGFRGEFRVCTTETTSQSGVPGSMEGSVLDIKEREKIHRENSWLEEAKNHPLTKALRNSLRTGAPEITLKDSL